MTCRACLAGHRMCPADCGSRLDRWRFSRCLAALLVSVSPAMAAAQDGLETILQFGTPRAQLWAVLKDRPAGGANFAFARADQLGLNPDRQIWPYVAGTALSVSPLFQYDRNVNAGFFSDTISILGVPFTVDEDSRAKAAATVGAAVAGTLAIGVAQGTILSFSSRMDYQRAIGARFEVVNSTAAVNLGHTTQDWAYFDAGYGASRRTRALADDATETASLTIGKLFGDSGRNVQDLSVTYTRAEEQSVWQSRVRVNWTGMFGGAGMVRVGLEKGDDVVGSLLPRTTLSASYSNLVFDAPTTISASFTEKTGGQFFGSPRSDTTYSIRGERKVSDRLSVYMSYTNTDSTIAGFDNAGVDLGFTVSGFRF